MSTKMEAYSESEAEKIHKNMSLWQMDFWPSSKIQEVLSLQVLS